MSNNRSKAIQELMSVSELVSIGENETGLIVYLSKKPEVELFSELFGVKIQYEVVGELVPYSEHM